MSFVGSALPLQPEPPRKPQALEQPPRRPLPPRPPPPPAAGAFTSSRLPLPFVSTTKSVQVCAFAHVSCFVPDLRAEPADVAAAARHHRVVGCVHAMFKWNEPKHVSANDHVFVFGS